MLSPFIENPCEDSLTASVFTHLLHLPGELFWQILRQSCYSTSLPQVAGEPRREVEFWPKWQANETRNSRYVEPDVFVRFPSFDLIVEAKRHDDCQQDHEQWRDELIAYHNEYSEEKVPVHLVALGGIWQTKDEAIDINGVSCLVHMCRWSSLLLECQRMVRELAGIKYPSSQTRAHQRVLLDLIHLFSRHGFQTGTWFSDVVPSLPILSASLQARHKAFHRLSSQLCQL